MTPEETAWVAGIIEGEGCFDGNASNLRYPRLRLQMTDRDVVERVHALVGGRITQPRKQKPHHKDTWLLSVTKREEILPLLDAIRPWMGARRLEKIDSLIERVV